MAKRIHVKSGRLEIKGLKFGKLLVLEDLPGIRNHSAWCRVRCDCGVERDMKSNFLTKTRGTNSCGCDSHHSRTTSRSCQWKGCGEMSSKFWMRIKANARKRGLEFLISMEDVWGLFEKQNQKCALTGETIRFGVKASDNGTASLDRKNPDLGYTLDNIQWVHKIINAMKWDLMENRLFELCNLVLSKEAGPPSEDCLVSPKSNQWLGFENISKKAWSNKIRSAKERELEFNLTIEEAWQLFLAQNGRCAVTGQKLYFGDRYSFSKIATASLDRIDSKKGYTLDNVQWTHSDINKKLKGSLSMEELVQWCAKISDYNNVSGGKL